MFEYVLIVIFEKKKNMHPNISIIIGTVMLNELIS